MNRQGFTVASLIFGACGAYVGWVFAAAHLIKQGSVVAGIGYGLMSLPFIAMFFFAAWMFSR